jgi:DNA ligase-1
MQRFAALYEEIDQTTSTNAKVAALARYFTQAPPEDAAWALFFLTGRRIKRLLPARSLVEWTLATTGLPGWLLEESFSAVGDLAETVALLVAPPGHRAQAGAAGPLPLHVWVEERILPLRGLDDAEQGQRVRGFWRELERRELFLLHKLLTGELRVGVSQTLVMRAVAEVAGVDVATVAQRMMGDWQPTAAFLRGLIVGSAGGGEDPGARARPYPFYLASPLEEPPEALGARADWLAEWKWDGIRAQLVRRGGELFLWSRGEELVTDRFPEVRDAAARLSADSVLDGEVMAWRDERPLPFAVLQRRIGRQKLTPRILADAPATFVAYDLLEQGGIDLRELALEERRARLAALLDGVSPRLLVSPEVEAPGWPELAALRLEARERAVEGLMLKRRGSPYRAGRRRGDWWKWKIDPYTIDAVLIYAQPGHGRRANLLTDYTFAVWREGELLPIAKAYSGLSNEEILELDGWIRRHTRERFGPVRVVEPLRVFELHFEAIAASSRHKSGIAVRFPRIARERTDKAAAEADTLERVRALLEAAR